jgi:hypothetical protein
MHEYSQNDVSGISDEMISIEDTYKEMGFSQKHQSNDEYDSKYQSRNINKNKSMTIIEEESLEESQAMSIHILNF